MGKHTDSPPQYCRSIAGYNSTISISPLVYTE
jgi:hypothetical protein